MATFNPSSTIYVCNVPFDNTYKNQIWFESKQKQFEYFFNKKVLKFEEYTPVRKTLENGGLESRIRVETGIDNLESLACNYIMYQNAQHGVKWFYAFITKLIYINEEVTEIVFETDVYQTWRFDVHILESFVVREHSVTDIIGNNVVPESFNFQDYYYDLALSYDTLNDWGYMVASTECYATLDDKWTVRGSERSGIYQGLFFYYFSTVTALNSFIATVEEKGEDCIQFIAVVPAFNISGSTVAESGDILGAGYVKASTEPAKKDLTITYDLTSFTFDGYKPKNMKMYTAPYFNLIVTNHAGDLGVYNVEDFTGATDVFGEGSLTFKMFGDVSADPSITVYPYNYKGIYHNYDCGISISGFPQCSYNCDNYKLWLAKNQGTLALETASNVAQIIGGVALTLGTSGIGAGAGIGAVTHGAMGLLNTMNTKYQASKEPNQVRGGGAKSNLLTAMEMNRFDFYWQKVKREYAELIDNFFTMYGYAVNKIKRPNMSARPYFNYVETNNVNISGAIPNDDMNKLKAMFNNGVTFWRDTATVGDYSVDNSA